MSKSIEIDGRVYRHRRGKLVQIPPEWVGRTLHAQSKRSRPAKKPRKDRMQSGITGRADTAHGGKPGHPATWAPRHTTGRVTEREEE